MVFQEDVRAASEHQERLQRREGALREQGHAWRLSPVVQALQAMRGVPYTVAITLIAELGDLSRFDNPRPLMSDLGLAPSAYASGERRRQGTITNARNSFARRALIAGAWAYCFPAKVSRPLHVHWEKIPKVIQDLAWKAQVRSCKRCRSLMARGKNPTQVVVAIAREVPMTR
jgi:transposase